MKKIFTFLVISVFIFFNSVLAIDTYPTTIGGELKFGDDAQNLMLATNQRTQLELINKVLYVNLQYSR